MRLFKLSKGFGLMLAVFMLLAFSMLGLFALNLLGTGSQSYVQDLQSLQAFYLSEAARNYYLEYYLPWGNDFKDSTTQTGFCDITNKPFGSGSFSITQTSGRNSERSATVELVGTVGSISRKIPISFSDNSNLPRDLKNFCVFSDYSSATATTEIKDYVKIEGNVYIDGSTTMKDGSSYCQIGKDQSAVNKHLYANGNARLEGGTIYGDFYYNGTYTKTGGTIYGAARPINQSPIPIPQKTTINTTYFDKEIGVANGDNPDYTSPQTLYATELKGRNIYVKADVNIYGLISGPGSIVSTGKIYIHNYPSVSHYGDVGERVNLIAKNTIFIETASGGCAEVGGTWNGSYMTGRGALLYSQGAGTELAKIQIGNRGVSNRCERVRGSLLSPNGLIYLLNPAVHYGVIYGQRINSRDSLDFLGTVYGHIFVDRFYPSYNPPLPDTLTTCTLYQENINNTADNTNNSMEIPIKLRGLYSPKGTWQEAF